MSAAPIASPPGRRFAGLSGAMLAALAALTLLRLAVGAATPLSPDECYYWVWSRALAPGFLDHPPMVALFIRLGTALAGPGPLGIRLLAPLGAAAGTLLLAVAARDLLPGASERERDARATRAAIMLNATLVLGAGSVTMTPDTPLLVFWTAALAALGRVLRAATPVGRLAWWLVTGLAIGLSLDSKYTVALTGAGLAGWLCLSRAGRGHLRTPGPWLALLLAVVVFLPVLDWNHAHGWASFLKQGGRTADWHPARALRFEPELLGGQLGLATPILFVLFALGTARATRLRGDGAGGGALLAWTVLVPVAVFVQHALGDRVQANWPALLYPAAAIAAAAFAFRFWRAGSALGFAITALVYLQATFGLLPLPPRLDPVLRQLDGWTALARGADVQAGRGEFLVADEYGLAAELAHALPDRAVFGAEPRWRLFRLPHGAPAGSGLLLRSAKRRDGPDPALWDRIEPAGILVRGADGQVIERYRLFRVHARPAMAPALADTFARLP